MTAGDAALAAALAAALGQPVAPAPAARLGGGSIHEALRWHTAAGPAFVKLAPLADAPLLEAEADGLAALAAARALRVPRVLAQGTAGTRAFLALEWLELVPATPASDAALGERLAAQHRLRAPRFGFVRDNFIGRTPQANGWCDDWVEFLATRRFLPQLALAERNGHGGRLTERLARLVERLGAFYAGYRPCPSLLHGDLWSGNHGALADGAPAVYDPAPYHGDREADLAMTRLFGAAGVRFYAAYEASWPLAAGAAARVELLNLYHVLNHLNLFGGGYARAALAMTERLLAAAGG